MTGTRQLHFFLCPWCLLLEDLYYMAGLTNIFLMHFFFRHNIFFQYLSNIFFVSIWTEVIWSALGVLLIEYWSADWHYGAQWKSIIIATSLYNSTRNVSAAMQHDTFEHQEYTLIISTHVYNNTYWTLPKAQRTQGIEYFDSLTTSRSINRLWNIGQIQLGFVLQSARNA